MSDVLVIRRPQDGALVGSMPVDDPDAVVAAVDRVREVQSGWASLSAGDRARRMRGVRSAVEARSEEIADRIAAETGKPEGEALAEVLTVLSLLRYYERTAPRILRSRRVRTRWLFPKRAAVEWEPYGVVGIISPWNFPFILTMEPTITALFAGNGVVLKPSEHAPFTGALVPQLLDAGGIPEGLVRVVQGDGAVGAALVRAGVDRLHFTGSPLVGQAVMAGAAERLLPVSLELGGKDPAIVLDDADLDRAARGVAFGAFFNAGQTCVATARVYVVDEVYDAFLRKLTAETKALRAGSAGEVDVGPLTLRSQLEIVEEQLDEAVAAGARVLCGGQRVDPASNVFLPTLLADVPRGSRVLTEESFGPILPVVRVRDEEEAVREANSLPFGLFASVWTQDRARGERIARELRAGGVSVNDTLTHWAVPGLPMGGVGRSGFSRVRGEEGLLAFSRSRTLLTDRLGLARDPWWFPYSATTRRLVSALIAFEGRSGVRRLTGAIGAFLRRSP